MEPEKEMRELFTRYLEDNFGIKIEENEMLDLEAIECEVRETEVWMNGR